MAIGFSLLPIWANHRGYWILLTIVVILKPGFSVSKTKINDRLIGTLLGAAVSFLLLYYIHSSLALLIILLVFMFFSYSFSSLNYLWSVFSTSVFVLIFFHFEYPGSLNFVQDRIVDTTIGFFIALASIYTIFPSWEFLGIPKLLSETLASNLGYINTIFPQNADNLFHVNEYKLARKDISMRLSNLDGAIARMSKEPYKKQVHLQEFYNLAVLNTKFAGQISALGSYFLKKPQIYWDPDQHLFLKEISQNLEFCKTLMNTNPTNILQPLPVSMVDESSKRANLEKLESLQHSRFEEIKGGITESSTQMQLREHSFFTERFEHLLKLSEDILKECRKIA
jgi:uncharacterized membrane protein YccC